MTLSKASIDSLYLVFLFHHTTYIFMYSNMVMISHDSHVILSYPFFSKFTFRAPCPALQHWWGVNHAKCELNESPQGLKATDKKKIADAILQLEVQPCEAPHGYARKSMKIQENPMYIFNYLSLYVIHTYIHNIT